jgi:5-amino-6-(5-phosphoribosylamino)uracil reductase
MTAPPYVVLSCAMSVDGYIDDAGDERLILSNDEDLDRVDEVRSGVDAILVGAGTLRADNPRLLIRSADLRKRRVADGRTPDPIKVTVTSSGDLDPSADFFTLGDQEKLVYCPDDKVPTAQERIGGVATVVSTGPTLNLPNLLDDLGARGIGRLLVEGGSVMLTRFLTQGLADELHLVIAPFFVGDPRAPRFVGPGTFPDHRMKVAETRQLGDCVLIRYLARPA